MSTSAQLSEQMAFSQAEVLAAVSEWGRQTAVLALSLQRFEAAGGDGVLGGLSMVQWLAKNARLTPSQSTELLSLGRFLDEYTAFTEGLFTDQLSLGQVHVARRLHRRRFRDALHDNQHELAGNLAPLTLAGTETVVEEWKKAAEAVLDDGAAPIDPPCELTMARTIDDQLHGRINLHDAAATEFEKAIRTAITFEGDSDQRSLAERQGDALHDIAVFFNKHHDGDGTARHLPHVTISTDLSTVTTGRPEGVDDDTDRPMGPACTGAYLCDCVIHVILRSADGTPEKFGREFRTVPNVLRRQVAARDGGCRFPGCNRPVRFTDAHHVVHWSNFGPTDYDNVVLLCSRHHHYVHRQKLQVRLLPDWTLDVIWPDGRHEQSKPRGAPPRQRPQPPV